LTFYKYREGEYLKLQAKFLSGYAKRVFVEARSSAQAPRRMTW